MKNACYIMLYTNEKLSKLFEILMSFTYMDNSENRQIQTIQSCAVTRSQNINIDCSFQKSSSNKVPFRVDYRSFDVPIIFKEHR